MTLKFLKLALLVITTLIGIYGTTHDFKRDGKPTRAGRFAVAVLILSGLIAVALQFVEFNKEKQAANAARDELEKIRLGRMQPSKKPIKPAKR